MPPEVSAERLDRFMARANAAYYATHDPFRDFTTAPEISQVFGELLGAWAAVAWASIGRPDPVLLVEAGPGRGTLMADMLRVIGRVAPDFAAAQRVHLIETSPRLRAQQAARVAGATWHEALEDVPAGPVILIANEFLDALPIRQFERTQSGWAERHVAAARFALQPCAPLGFMALGQNAAPGAVLEHGEAAQAWVGRLAARLAAAEGAALLLDYGREAPGFGDTLQALAAGRPADPLVPPGTADLTAHVDFPALAEAATAAGAVTWGPLAQGVFLGRLGLWARTAQLASRNPGRAAALHVAADRLAAPARMGQLFKAMALTSQGLAAPPGFEDHHDDHHPV